MPLIKTQREDILRQPELDPMFEKLSGQEEISGSYEVMLHGERIVQTFRIYCRMTECLIAMLWLFGKRIMEILVLKRKNVWVEGHFLYARFFVLKKKRAHEVIPVTTVKKITLSNPYTKYVLDYLDRLGEDPEKPMFPGRSRGKTFTVRATLFKKMEDGSTREVLKQYKYTRTIKGIMCPEVAWKVVKSLNPSAWLHLFRESVATTMAEHEATEEELMHWFDWERVETAHKYVKRGTKLIEKWSERKW